MVHSCPELHNGWHNSNSQEMPGETKQAEKTIDRVIHLFIILSYFIKSHHFIALSAGPQAGLKPRSALSCLYLVCLSQSPTCSPTWRKPISQSISGIILFGRTINYISPLKRDNLCQTRSRFYSSKVLNPFN